MVGDAHTRLDWEQTAPNFRTYTLRLYWFSDGLYVTATTADYRSALGSKLIQIGETEIDQVSASVSSLIPHDSAILFRLLSGLQDRLDLNQRGHFFVVIGRKTFSSAVINAVDLKKQTQAIFIGEPTGGKPNSCGEVNTFILPKSGLAIKYSTKVFKLIEDDLPSFTPDISAQISSSDYSAGQDPVLDAILAYKEQ